MKVWPKFTLVVEGREDGGIRVHSPEVLGLILSSKDVTGIFADLPLVINDLLDVGQYSPTGYGG